MESKTVRISETVIELIAEWREQETKFAAMTGRAIPGVNTWPDAVIIAEAVALDVSNRRRTLEKARRSKSRK